MLKYILFSLSYVFLLTSAYYGIPKHIEIIEADKAFNECLQDLTYQECRLGVYGV